MGIYISDIDNARIELDRLAQQSKAMAKSVLYDANPNAHFASRSLYMAKAWLGKMKFYLGEPSPYETVDKEENLPLMQEVYKGSDNDPYPMFANKMQQVDVIREDIAAVLEDVIGLITKDDRKHLHFTIVNAHDWAMKSIMEAGINYGFELGVIRDEALKQK